MKILLSESQLLKLTKNIVKEDIVTEQISLPIIISSGYTAGNCDELHAFQGTGGKVIGNMNVIVKQKLDECKGQGMNVWVSDVKINVMGMNVNWTVTISESDDKQFWGGFTSRGAGCNNDIKNRWNSETVGNGVSAIENSVKQKVCSTMNSLQLVKKIDYSNLGNNSFIQGFYRYKC